MQPASTYESLRSNSADDLQRLVRLPEDDRKQTRYTGAMAGDTADAGKGEMLGWGLWNPLLTEWFNPGTKKPYYPTKEAAKRMLPRANREYSMGTWELREYRLEDLTDSDVVDEPQQMTTSSVAY